MSKSTNKDTRHHDLTILFDYMIDLIQSLHPHSLQRGITHSWMGETWMVDGEASVMMMAIISSNSPSRQGARTEFVVSNRGFWLWRHNGTLSRKTSTLPSIFRSEGLCMRRGRLRGFPRW